MDPLAPHVNSARRAQDSGYETTTRRIMCMPDSEEKIRRLCVANLLADPEHRKLMEAVYGKVACQLRYPEVYRREELDKL